MCCDVCHHPSLQVNRACSALLAWYAARKAPAADVLIHPKPEWVSLVFNLKKVPNNPSNKPKAMYVGGTWWMQ